MGDYAVDKGSAHWLNSVTLSLPSVALPRAQPSILDWIPPLNIDSREPFRCTGMGPSAPAAKAARQIEDHVMRSYIRFLADDLLEGRGPASRGDAIAQLYIRTHLEAMGIEPGGNTDDEKTSWSQPVPLVGVSTSPPTSFSFHKGDLSVHLNHHDDMMLTSGKPVNETLSVTGDLVFVGYGMQATEYEWDDFKDVDVTGKILVIMNNDLEDDPNLFGGRKRLYNGRWDYKYAQDARM